MFRMTFFVLLFVFTAAAYSLDKVEAQQVLELDTSTDVILDYHSVQPFFLSFDSEDKKTLKIPIINYIPQTTAQLEHNLFLNIDSGEMIRRDDVDIILDSPFRYFADSPVIIENGRPSIEEFPFFSDRDHSIFYAVLSPDNRLLATLETIPGDTDFIYVYYNISLWKKNIKDPIYGFTYDMYSNMLFTSSENYFFCRGFALRNYVDFFISDNEFRATLETTLIRLNDLKQFESHGDIAFTSNERYFVTERDLMPTLVDAQTDQNILQYNMPVRLVAAVFSPDQKQLFLTGTDNKLYIFDSHLPAGVGGWMLQ